MSHPSAADGQIKIKYGRRDGDLFLCAGVGTSRADAHLLMGAVMDRVLDADFATRYTLELNGMMTDGILKQLEERGYDPTTLEISIRKKPQQEE